VSERRKRPIDEKAAENALRESIITSGNLWLVVSEVADDNKAVIIGAVLDFMCRALKWAIRQQSSPYIKAHDS
jgi:hypothetical protein